MKHKVFNYNTIFQKEDTGYSVWVPELPGCASQGETFEEALDNIKEAIILYLDDEKDIEDSDINNQFMVPVSISV
jgi:predicted RNase H-like HicB family nuclease